MNNTVSKNFSFVITAAFLFLSFSLFTGCAAKRSGTEGVSYPHLRATQARGAGIKAFSKNNPPLALKSFKAALKIDRSIDDKESEVLDLINLARVSIASGDLSGAGSYLNSAIKTGLDAGNEERLGAAYVTLAKVDFLAGRSVPALSHIKESIRLDEKSGFKSGAALNLFGSILLEAGRTKEARSVFESALKLNTESNDRLEEANSYRSLGHLSTIEKKYDKAARFYSQAYTLDKKAGTSRKIALDLTSLASILIRQGFLFEATYKLERSYTVNINSGRYLEAIANLTLLVDTFDRLGNAERVNYFTRLKGTLIKSYESGKAQQRTESR